MLSAYPPLLACRRACVRTSAAINSSLLSLHKCMEALRMRAVTGTNVRIPYAEDNLTKIFRVYFEGLGQTVRGG